MYKHLYDNFKHWYHEDRGSIFLYSDPHFADEEANYLRKDYIGDEEQVKRINSKLGKYDTIIFLGDIGNVEFIKKIRGYKVLIMGNHDSGTSNYIRKQWLEDDEEPGNGWRLIKKDNHLFDEVYEGPVIISEKIILSHEPINLPFMYNIHGHCHGLPAVYDKLHFNICAENIDYTPIRLDHLIKYGVLKNIDSIHRITIDTATERKRQRKKNNY